MFQATKNIFKGEELTVSYMYYDGIYTSFD